MSGGEGELLEESPEPAGQAADGEGVAIDRGVLSQEGAAAMRSMTDQDLEALCAAPLAVLRLKPAVWQDILEKRHHGTRFSLTFPHAEARVGKRNGLVLISSEDDLTRLPVLRIGLIRSIAATATLDSRVSFDLVSDVLPGALDYLLAGVSASELKTPRAKLLASSERFERVSDKLGEALLGLLAAIPDNGAALRRIVAHLRRPVRYDSARALAQDAVVLAIKAFGGGDGATTIALPGADTAIATVRVREDAAIEHDARWIPGWTLQDSDLTGSATFERNGEKLEVFTANKRPLEELFGVDLMYLNEARGALVMVQYKMMEPEGAEQIEEEEDEDAFSEEGDEAETHDDREWLVRIDDQFTEELERMRLYDQDLDPTGAYRLHAGAFFFKLMKRLSSTKASGILLSLGHFDALLANGSLRGARGALRISYRELAGHYLRGDAFVELVRSGYIGTRGATTTHLQDIVDAALKGGKAVVVAIQTAMKAKGPTP